MYHYTMENKIPIGGYRLLIILFPGIGNSWLNLEILEWSELFIDMWLTPHRAGSFCFFIVTVSI